jgi:hypothetical protein
VNPGSGKSFFPEPGTQTHIFEILVTFFWGKSTKSLREFARYLFKNNAILSIVKFEATKKGRTTDFFPPLLLLLLDLGWIKVRIRDKSRIRNTERLINFVFVLNISVVDSYSFLRIRIPIQSLMLETNTDPDPNPDPIRIQGLNDQKLKKKLQLKFSFFFFDQKLQFTYP